MVDNDYLKPLFTQSRPTLIDTMPKNSFAQWIARVLTTTQQMEVGRSSSYSAVGSTGVTPSPPNFGNNNSDDEPIMATGMQPPKSSTYDR